jgi:hypothetical protein
MDGWERCMMYRRRVRREEGSTEEKKEVGVRNGVTEW